MHLVPVALLVAVTFGGPANETAPEPIAIDSALVTLIEQAEIPAKVDGVLASLKVREGQMIKEGDVIGQIEDTEARLAVDKSKIELDIARKQAKNDVKVRVAKKASELATVELKRALESIEKYRKSVSETELDRLRLAAEKGVLDIEQSVFEQETAELTATLKDAERRIAAESVERRRVLSTINGIVVQVNPHQGEWVEAGKPVCRIIRIDRLRVEGFVPVKKIVGELPGRRVMLTVDLPGKPGAKFAGQVVFVHPEVNPVNGQVRVWAEIENPDLTLSPGLQGQLTIGPEPARTAKK